MLENNKMNQLRDKKQHTYKSFQKVTEQEITGDYKTKTAQNLWAELPAQESKLNVTSRRLPGVAPDPEIPKAHKLSQLSESGNFQCESIGDELSPYQSVDTIPLIA